MTTSSEPVTAQSPDDINYHAEQLSRLSPGHRFLTHREGLDYLDSQISKMLNLRMSPVPGYDLMHVQIFFGIVLVHQFFIPRDRFLSHTALRDVLLTSIGMVPPDTLAPEDTPEEPPPEASPITP